MFFSYGIAPAWANKKRRRRQRWRRQQQQPARTIQQTHSQASTHQTTHGNRHPHTETPRPYTLGVQRVRDLINVCLWKKYKHPDAALNNFLFEAACKHVKNARNVYADLATAAASLLCMAGAFGVACTDLQCANYDAMCCVRLNAGGRAHASPLARISALSLPVGDSDMRIHIRIVN